MINISTIFLHLFVIQIKAATPPSITGKLIDCQEEIFGCDLCQNDTSWAKDTTVVANYDAAVAAQKANTTLIEPVYLEWSTDQETKFQQLDAQAEKVYNDKPTVPKQLIFKEKWNPLYTYSCLECDNDFFLYKHYSYAKKEFKSICVISCEHTDRQTITDLEKNQCVFMGPYCEVTTTVKDSNTGKEAISCFWSHMNDHGYVLGSRYRILNYLSQTTYVDKSSSVNDLEGYKVLETKYINPMEGINGDYTPEYNVQVVAQCQNKYCNLCVDWNLTKCQTCWGRFGDQSSYGRCYDTKTCSGSPAFQKGCYKANFDCSGCEICDTGHTIETATKTCTDCKDIDSNCLECSGQSADGSLKCDICVDGYGIDSSTGKCKQCTDVFNIKQCEFDTSGKQKNLLCNQGYALSSSGTECNKYCKENEFIKIQYHEEHQVEMSVYCSPCHSTCGSCFDDQDYQCQSCKSGRFLKINSTLEQTGSCIKKTDATMKDIQILVTNSDSASKVSGDYMASNFMDAIYKAFKITTNFTKQSVTILLETGNHLILDDHHTQYLINHNQDFWIDMQNPQFNMTIKPLDCTDKLNSNIPQNVYSCRTQKSDQTTLYNKIGKLFYIVVPNSLVFEGITIDGLNSYQREDAPSRDKDTIDDCIWQGDQVVCPNLSEDQIHRMNKNPICPYRSYESIFQFRTIDKEIKGQYDVQRLEIRNATFQNIHYELGSIVRLPERMTEGKIGMPFNLSITESNFMNMSFCGSIVSNDFPKFEATIDNPSLEVMGGLKNQIDQHYGLVSSSTTALNCSGAIECFIFQFQKNTIQNLFQLKRSSSKMFDEKVNYQMEKFGLAIHLQDFRGHVTIEENSFSDTYINYDDVCIYYQNDTSLIGKSFDMTPASSWTRKSNLTKANNNVATKYLIPKQNDGYQVHSLIMIDNLQEGKNVKINSNSFKNILVSNGVITISQKARSPLPNFAPYNPSTKKVYTADEYLFYEDEIRLQSNIFESVGSYLGTNAIVITKLQQRQITSNKIDKYNSCGWGIAVLDNTFNKIAGTCQTDTGLVRFQCNYTDATSDTAYYPANTDYSFISRARSMVKGPQAHFNQFADLKDYRSSKYGVQFLRNTITNVANGNSQKQSFDESKLPETQQYTGSLITFEGITRIEMQDNTLTNIFPLNIDRYYEEHSPFFNILGHKSIGALQIDPLWQLTFAKDDNYKTGTNGPIPSQESSSLISINNAYEIIVQRNTIDTIYANYFTDSYLMTITNTPQYLNLTDTSIGNVIAADTGLISFNSLSVASGDIDDLSLFPHTIVEIVNVNVNGVSYFPVTSKKSTKLDALIFDSIQSNFYLANFTMKNSKFQNIVRQSFSVDPQISTILKVQSKNITIDGNTFDNINVLSKTQQLSPVQLVKAQYTDATDFIPQILVRSSSFSNIIFGPGEYRLKLTDVDSDVSALGGLISVDIPFSTSDSQSINFDSVSFSSIEPRFALEQDKDQFNDDRILTVVDFIKIVYKDNTAMTTLSLKNCQFDLKNRWRKTLVQDVDKKTLVQDSMISRPIDFGKVLDKVSFENGGFTNMQNAWNKGLEKSETVLIELDSSKWLFNSFTIDGTSFKGEYQDSTIAPSSDSKNNFHVFKINGYSATDMITFKNLAVDGLDFYQSTDQVSGSFLNLQYSTIKIESATIQNINTFGSFMLVDSSSAQIEVSSSSFKNIRTSNKGSVLYYSNMNLQPYLFFNQQQVKFTSTTFDSCQAQESGVIFASTTNTQFEFDTVTATSNVAQDSNSFGQFIGLRGQPSDPNLLIKSSTFSGNKVSSGSALISLNHTSMTASDSVFKDNTATVGTKGFKIDEGHIVLPKAEDIDSSGIGNMAQKFDIADSGNKKQVLNISPQIVFSKCQFDSVSTTTSNDLKSLQGAYVQVNKLPFDSSATLEYDDSTKFLFQQVFLPEITINGGSFKNGQALRGGVFYAEGINYLTLKVMDVIFDSNKAGSDGGVFYLENPDYHQLAFEKVTFTNNICGNFGDTIFLKTSQRSDKVATLDEIYTNLQRRRLQTIPAATQQMKRAITIQQGSFTTPKAHGQIYLEKVAFVDINNNKFAAITDSQALDGGSVVCIDCYTASFKSNEFTSQQSLIKGGALYLTQDQSQQYFGQDWKTSIITIDSNKFKQCEAQQGGAIYTNNLYSVKLTGTNEFDGNIAQAYKDDSKFQPTSDQKGNKTVSIPASEEQSGQGASLYYECQKGITCSGTIDKTTVFKNDAIQDAKSGAFSYYEKRTADNTVLPIFYSGQKPTVDATQAALIQREWKVSLDGAKVVIMSDATELATLQKTLLETVEKGVSPEDISVKTQKDLTQENLQLLYKIDKVVTWTTKMFGTSPIAILDSFGHVQVHDNNSTVTISILDNNLTISEMLIDPAGQQAIQFTYKAKDGLFTIPDLRAKGTPGSLSKLDYNFTLVQNAGKSPVYNNQTFNLNFLGCPAGTLIDADGLCQTCSSNDTYLLGQFPPQRINGQINIQSCDKCNNDIFTCQGTDKIMSVIGYQKLENNTDFFTKCPRINGKNLCNADNNCIPGYTGLKCGVCTLDHFRDFDGSCQLCPKFSRENPDSAMTKFIIIITWVINWVGIFLVVTFISKMAHESQKQHKLSTGFYLFKSMTNYVLYIVILSEVYMHSWYNPDIKENKVFKMFLEYIRYLYRLPMNMFDWQCDLYSFPPADISKMDLVQNKINFEGKDKRYQTAISVEILFWVMSFMTLVFLLNSFVLKSNKKEEKNDLSFDGDVVMPEQKQEEKTVKIDIPNDGFALNEERDKDYESGPQPPSLMELAKTPIDQDSLDGIREKNYESEQREMKKKLNAKPLKSKITLQDSIKNRNSLSQSNVKRSQTVMDKKAPPVNALDFLSESASKDLDRDQHEGGDIDNNATANFEGRRFAYVENQSMESPFKTQQNPQRSQYSPPYMDRSVSPSRYSTKSYRSKNLSLVPLQAQQQLATQGESPQLNKQQLDKIKRFQFNRFTLALMIFGFCMNTFVFDQLISMDQCESIKVVGAADPKDERIAKYEQMQFNFFDPEIKCEGYGVNDMIKIVYIGVWGIILPMFILIRSPREYIIEVIGSFIRLSLIIIAKYSRREGIGGFWMSILVSAQMLVFLIFKNGQSKLESEKQGKLKELNQVDTLMYLVICMSSYIGLIQLAFVDDLSKLMFEFFSLLLLTVNSFYILFWLYRSIKYLFKHLKRSEKGLKFYHILTCGCYNEKVQEDEIVVNPQPPQEAEGADDFDEMLKKIYVQADQAGNNLKENESSFVGEQINKDQIMKDIMHIINDSNSPSNRPSLISNKSSPFHQQIIKPQFTQHIPEQQEVYNEEELISIAEDILYRKYLEDYDNPPPERVSDRYLMVQKLIENNLNDGLNSKEIEVITQIEARILDEMVQIKAQRAEEEKLMLQERARKEELEKRRKELERIEMERELQAQQANLKIQREQEEQRKEEARKRELEQQMQEEKERQMQEEKEKQGTNINLSTNNEDATDDRTARLNEVEDKTARQDEVHQSSLAEESKEQEKERQKKAQFDALKKDLKEKAQAIRDLQRRKRELAQQQKKQ